MGGVDLYRPAGRRPAPAIIFVHGGPLSVRLRPTPRDWPVYQGYASFAANRGAVGVTVDHRLHDQGAYPVAAEDAAAVQVARDDPGVDADRIALWFFSGGGPLLADWLRVQPPWLRCVAASYPVLDEFPGFPLDHRFRPVEAVAGAGATPIILTRAGQEVPAIAETQDAFVDAARAAGIEPDIIDVPDGRHGFDMLDDTDASRAAIVRAMTSVLSKIESTSRNVSRPQ